MKQTYDVAVIGGGIVGLAHAWAAARQGKSVALFERGRQAHGASIRNFGMVWPIGQPVGELYETALQSRRRWLELSQAGALWAAECGSLHLAYREDERAVLEEFCENAAADFQVRWLSPAEVLKRSPAANPDGLLGGMWSDTELCVNPRQAVAEIPRWLAERFSVDTYFSTSIVRVQHPHLTAADGRTWRSERILVCSGSDFETLFPDIFAETELTRCKLQMMKTAAQPDAWRLGPHIAGGLTLQHYTSFADCSSLPALRKRIAEETPELNRYGIHVMASQNNRGEVILGDSHEYDEEISPFDKSEIETLMLRELRRLLRLPDWNIAERWSGVYAKLPGRSHFEAEPESGVKIVVAPGGAGMTMSFGLAEQIWNRWS